MKDTSRNATGVPWNSIAFSTMVFSRFIFLHLYIFLLCMSSVHSLYRKELQDLPTCQDAPAVASYCQPSKLPPLRRLHDVAVVAGKALSQSFLLVAYYNEYLSSSCVYRATLHQIAASLSITKDSFVAPLCNATLIVDSLLLSGIKGGDSQTDPPVFPLNGTDALVNGTCEGEVRMRLMMWALELMQYPENATAAALLLVSTEHINHVIGLSDALRTINERWAFWFLYGATQQIVAVCSVTDLEGLGGVATATSLNATLTRLNLVAPSKQMDTLRAAVTALIPAPPAGQPPSDDCSTNKSKCPLSQPKNFLVQLFWALGGGLALLAAVAFVLLLLVKRKRQRAEARARELAERQAVQMHLDYGNTRRASASVLSKVPQDPNLLCTTVVMPDGQTAIAVGRLDDCEEGLLDDLEHQEGDGTSLACSPLRIRVDGR
eukprot:TRINITY_DN2801_c0_g1_i1.p1 TRINITY_DN2801_c0_g1~~TRINITY_DN2801_c0_g1_i1.p1  ORF type:complete len:434 (+),score=48.50 TRINITY_DN2801_c0_g1_i1:406-1707(+)